MKNTRFKKRKLFPFFALLCSFLMITSCSDDDLAIDTPINQGDEINFIVGIGSQSKVSTDIELKSVFEETDAIGIFAVARTNAATQAYPSSVAADNLMHNIKYTKQADGTWKSAENTKYYYPQNSIVDFYAYYPYVENADPASISYDASTNNTDLMTARTIGVAESNDAVSLSFHHKLALVQVLVKSGPYEDLTVKMVNAKINAKMNLTSPDQANEITISDKVEDIAMISEAGVYRAYIPAQDIEGGKDVFKFEYNGETFYYTTTAEVKLTSAKAKKFSISIPVASPLIAPNTYIVSPGEHMEISVEKAFAMWKYNPVLKATQTDLSGEITAELVWQDVEGMIPAANIKVSGTGRDAVITLKSDVAKGEGNAVIAMKIGEKIYWSWHIWVIDYDPNDPNNQDTNNGFTFMDRNLGATSSAVGDTNSTGLQYQWGRKDPIPAPLGWPTEEPKADETVFPDRPIWNANGSVALAFGTVTDNITDNLIYSINNPLSFIKTTGWPYDWYSTTENQGNDRWNTEDNTKTMFDPCPEGWRVPTSGLGSKSPWFELRTAYIAWDKGPEYNLAGYFPGGGYRSSLTPTTRNYSLMGYYWAATPYVNPDDPLGYDGSAYNFHFTSLKDILPDTKNYRAIGMSVRCVKE